MKPIETTVEVQSNFSGEVLEGGLDSEQIGMFTSMILTNYRDILRASVTELLTNAADSHKMARVKRPVLMTVPSRLDPTLIIEDFGLGMSFEDFENVYMRALRSLKRDTNTAVGFFGLGSKAILGVTPQYTVSTVKDGLRNVFLVELVKGGGFGAKVLKKNEPTDAPNGFKVTAPIRDSNHIARFSRPDFYNAVIRGYSEDELVVVNGPTDVLERVKRISETHQKFTHGFYGPKTHDCSIIVGNTVYPVDYNLGELQRELQNVYGYPIVPVGQLSFPYSRETFEITTRNQENILAAIRAFKAETDAFIQKKINNSATWEEAAGFLADPYVLNEGLQVRFKGELIEPETDVELYEWSGGVLQTFTPSSSSAKAAIQRIISNKSNKIVFINDRGVGEKTARLYMREVISTPEARKKYGIPGMDSGATNTYRSSRVTVIMASEMPRVISHFVPTIVKLSDVKLSRTSERRSKLGADEVRVTVVAGAKKYHSLNTLTELKAAGVKTVVVTRTRGNVWMMKQAAASFEDIVFVQTDTRRKMETLSALSGMRVISMDKASYANPIDILRDHPALKQELAFAYVCADMFGSSSDAELLESFLRVTGRAGEVNRQLLNAQGKAYMTLLRGNQVEAPAQDPKVQAILESGLYSMRPSYYRGGAWEKEAKAYALWCEERFPAVYAQWKSEKAAEKAATETAVEATA